MRHTLFISDIHLESKQEDLTRSFLDFLKTTAPQADALYILGDLFEAWIGDDDNTPFHQTIQSALHTLSQHIPVYFMRGNRDFLIGQMFAQRTGCTILPDPSTIRLYDKPILLSHGDMFCTHDALHQKFRTLSQNTQYNRYFLSLPLVIRRWIAKMIRQKSRKYTKQIDNTTMDVVQEAVMHTMSAHKVDLLIHGHTHRPHVHTLTTRGQTLTRIVLGDWHPQGKILRYDEDGTFSLT